MTAAPPTPPQPVMAVPPPLESWRPFFPAAAGLGALGLGAWAAQLGGIDLGLLPVDHAGFMLWGVLGTAVFGFLLVAYARQNDAPLPRRPLIWALLALQVVAAAAHLVGRPLLPAPLRAGLLVLPWLGLCAWAIPVARASLARRWEATTATVPLALVGALVGAGLHGLGTTAVRGIDVGVHAFIAPLALAVLDRVLPFFSRSVPGYDGRRQPWFLGPLVALSWLKVLLPAAAPWAAAALVALLLRQWWGWRPWPASKNPMLGVLHLGIAWFGIAWGMEAAGAPRSASLHALLVGGLGTLLFGIATRVARGHSGLPIVLGRAGMGVLVLAQVATVLRVAVGVGAGTPGWLVGSATALALAFLGWAGRFVPLAAGKKG